MTRGLLRKCTACHDYTLEEICPSCGAAATDPRPAKFSPEDHYGSYRRDLKRLAK
ncbi:MAG: RNA-protein complex protein Nop10 [Thermoplasmatota archaeon]